VKQGVTGLVRSEAGAGKTAAAKGPLGNRALIGSTKGASPVLHLPDELRRQSGHHLYSVLVCQVVAALHCIKGVFLWCIISSIGHVCQCTVYATLRCNRVGPYRVHLRQYCYIMTGGCSLNSSSKAGQTTAHHNYLVVLHSQVPLSSRSSGHKGRQAITTIDQCYQSDC